MTEPMIAAKTPAVMDAQPGAYFYCTCGKSANQPFCDGSHAGSGFQPMKFELTEAKKCAFCRCKRTKNAPYCDGSHRNLPA